MTIVFSMQMQEEVSGICCLGLGELERGGSLRLVDERSPRSISVRLGKVSDSL